MAHRARVVARAWAFALPLAAALAVPVVAPGCAPHAPQTVEQRAARAQALIESGNAAYRQGDYRLAVKRYAAAAVERKDDPAAYYGMGMALGKLGRDEEARKAYQQARDLVAASGGQAPAVPPQHP